MSKMKLIKTIDALYRFPVLRYGFRFKGEKGLEKAARCVQGLVCIHNLIIDGPDEDSPPELVIFFLFVYIQSCMLRLTNLKVLYLDFPPLFKNYRYIIALHFTFQLHELSSFLSSGVMMKKAMMKKEMMKKEVMNQKLNPILKMIHQLLHHPAVDLIPQAILKHQMILALQMDLIQLGKMTLTHLVTVMLLMDFSMTGEDSLETLFLKTIISNNCQ